MIDRYLKREPHGWAVLGLILGAWLLILAWILLVAGIWLLLGLHPSDSNSEDLTKYKIDNSLGLSLVLFAVTAAVEELVERIVPLRIGVSLLPNKGIYVLVFVLAAGIAYLQMRHAFDVALWLQSAGSSVLLSFVYLKCGGFARKFYKPALCTYAVRMLEIVQAALLLFALP